MKISLELTQGLISVTALVRIKNWRVYGSIKFFIDTGSPKSFIGEQDATRLQIPIKKVNFNERAIMGGTSISIGKIESNVRISFITKNQSLPIEPLNFYVSKGMWKKEGLVCPNPSILGNDFLLENKFALYHNPYKNITHLERED